MLSPQNGRRPVVALVVLIVAIAAALAGCSPAAKHRGEPEPTPTAPPKHCTVDDCPALADPAGRIGPSGVTDENAASTVPKYLTTVLDDLDTVWPAWFTQLNITRVTPGRVLISGSDTFTSECTDEDGKTVAVDSDFPNAFFCPKDTQKDGAGHPRTGSVILPVQTFADIWDGKLMGQRGFLLGDFSASTIVAHEYGHNVMYRMADAYGMTPEQYPTGDDTELLADCFAGNWLATVYRRDELSVKEIGQAVVLMASVADPVNGMGHGSIPARVSAISRGFGVTGDSAPVTCLKKYWPQALGSA